MYIINRQKENYKDEIIDLFKFLKVKDLNLKTEIVKVNKGKRRYELLVITKDGVSTSLVIGKTIKDVIEDNTETPSMEVDVTSNKTIKKGFKLLNKIRNK